MDAQYSYSKTISVDIKARNNIYLQSNPVSSQLVIVNQNQQPVRRIQVTDISGRIISSKAINSNTNTITIAVTDLQAGYYLLRVDAITLPFIRQ